MANWILAIDESGAVNDANEPAVLGGVLTCHYDTSAFRNALKARIRHALPGVPWPPHAAELNRASARAFYAAAGVSGASSSALDAAKALRVSGSTTPTHEQLKQSDDQLRKAQWSLYRKLSREVDRGREAMRGVFAELAGEGTAWIVGAWEGPSDRPAGVERYVRLMDTLASRVELVLSRFPSARATSSHGVLLRSARYYDGDANFAELRQLRRLNSAKLGVTWTTLEPSKYRGEDCHPLLVLADAACNQLRRVARDADESDLAWPAFSGEVTARIGLAAEPTNRDGVRLPSISSAGAADALVARAVELMPASGPRLEALHAEIDASGAGEPRWARDQAHAWLTVLSMP